MANSGNILEIINVESTFLFSFDTELSFSHLYWFLTMHKKYIFDSQITHYSILRRCGSTSQVVDHVGRIGKILHIPSFCCYLTLPFTLSSVNSWFIVIIFLSYIAINKQITWYIYFLVDACYSYQLVVGRHALQVIHPLQVLKVSSPLYLAL